MKCKNIHDGFEKKEIREFLSKSITEACDERYLVMLQKQIDELQAKLVMAKQNFAACELVTQQGWQLHDVSDEVEDYDASCYFNFVGTEEELSQLLRSIYTERICQQDTK